VGKSPKTLDVMNFVSYLLALDHQSKLSTVVMLIPGGSTTAPSCSIHLLSSALNTSPWDPMEVFRTVYPFPSVNSKTFEAALFKSAVDHDAAFSREVFLKTCTK